MSKLKQRKRLTTLAIMFLLVFLTGAAFAFTPGMLDIVGRVGITEGDYVVWSGAVATVPDGQDASLIEVNTATIVDETRGRTFQRIHWDVVFNAEAQAILQATLTNEGVANAYISGVRFAAGKAQFPVVPFGDVTAHNFYDLLNHLTNDPVGDSDALGATEAEVTIHPQLLNEVFTIGGTFADAGDYNNLPGFVGLTGMVPGNSSLSGTVTVDWNGIVPWQAIPELERAYMWIAPPGDADTLDPRLFTERSAFVTALSDANLISGTAAELPSLAEEWLRTFDGEGLWVQIPGVYRVMGDGAGGHNYFWRPGDDNDRWVGSFILEFWYELAGPGGIAPSGDPFSGGPTTIPDGGPGGSDPGGLG